MSGHGDKGRDRFSGVVARLNGPVRRLTMVPGLGAVYGVEVKAPAHIGSISNLTFEPFAKYPIRKQTEPFNPAAAVAFADEAMRNTGGGVTKPDWNATVKLRSCGHPLGTTSWCPDCTLAEAYRTGEFR